MAGTLRDNCILISLRRRGSVTLSSRISPAVSRIAGGHHISGVEHLLGELRHCEGGVTLTSAGREGGESGHEEVKAGEGDHVDGELSKICIQLTGESKASRHT